LALGDGWNLERELPSSWGKQPEEKKTEKVEAREGKVKNLLWKLQIAQGWRGRVHCEGRRASGFEGPRLLNS